MLLRSLMLFDVMCLAPYGITGVCEKTFLLREPLPCSPTAETAIQPLIGALKANIPMCIILRRTVFVTDAGITAVYAARLVAEHALREAGAEAPRRRQGELAKIII